MAILTAFNPFDYRNIYSVAEAIQSTSVIDSTKIILTDFFVTYELEGVGLSRINGEITGELQGLSINVSDEQYLTLTGASYDLDNYYQSEGYQPLDSSRLFGMTAEFAAILAGDDKISGSSFADRISGFNGADTIYGFGGSDWLEGGGGGDLIFGGAGADTLFGQSGNDTLNGEDGDDFIRGGAGDDVINGGAGFDLADYRDATAGVTINLNVVTQNNIAAGVGTDKLSNIESIRGSNFGDTLTGNALDNSFRGGMGNDTIDGRGGFDWASYRDATGAVYVNLALGQSTGAEGTDQLINIEAVRGGVHHDTLIGDGGDNWLRGGRGNDTLDGGAGIDWADYLDATGAVTVSLLSNTSSGADGNDTLINIERIRGGKFADALTGNHADNALRGGLGNDTINGQGGFDVASYWDARGSVTVNLSLASNQATGADGTDQLISIEGVSSGHFDDRLTGNAADNWLSGNRGNDTIDGGGGIDMASYRDATGSVNVNLSTGMATGADGNDVLLRMENVEGGNFADTLTGDAGNNLLRGRGGNDTLDGGAGIDTADYSEKTSSVVVTLNGATAVNVSVGGIVEDSIKNIENVTGGAGADTLTGDGLANMLTGNAGNDLLLGLGGNDVLRGGAGKDTLDGGAGADTADYSDKTTAVVVTVAGSTDATVTVGGVAEDVIRNIEHVTGGSAADRLTGNGLANTLKGNAGNDVLNGKGGNDILQGGAGQDMFRFDTALNSTSNVDRIVDFTAVDDTIQLARSIFGSLGTTTGVINSAHFKTIATGGQTDSNDFIVYDQSTGALYYDANGSVNGMADAVQFATLGTNLTLTHADFVMI